MLVLHTGPISRNSRVRFPSPLLAYLFGVITHWMSILPRLDTTVYDLRVEGAVVGIAGRLDIQVG